MRTSLLLTLSFLWPSAVSAQVFPPVRYFGGPSAVEFLEEFDAGFLGEAMVFGKGGEWEGPAFGAHTSPHTILLMSGNKIGATGIGTATTTCSSNFGYVAAGGFNIACVAASTTGLELFSNTSYLGKRPVVLGQDPDAEFCATVNVGDHDGFQVFSVGWRRYDNGTNYPDDSAGSIWMGDNYTDAVTLGVYGGDTAGAHDIKIGEIKNDAATVVTDTTDNWSEATDMEFCTRINSDGTYSQTLNGAAPTATAASPITLDVANEWYVPHLRYMHDGTANITSFLIKKWEVRFK